MTEFFLPMIPPTVTDQQHALGVRNGKPFVYDPPALKDAKEKLTAHLLPHAPTTPIDSGVRLIVRWCFPKGQHQNGEYRITRPDTDNLNKALKDCMTRCRFWKDDALVASELIEKFWAEIPGVYIRIEELTWNS